MSMNFFRDKRNSSITMVIFGFIILTFIFWGYFETEGPSQNALTTVNGEEVSYREYERLLNRQMENYGRVFGQGQKINKNLTEFIKRQVASTLITRKLLAQEARRLGVVVGNEELIAELKKIEAFQDPELKRFSPKIYKLVLDANGMNPTSFEESMREEIAARRVRQLVDNSLLISSQEAKDEQFIENYSFTLDTASLTADSLQKARKLDLSDDDLRAYYESNRSQFLTPEKRALRLARFDTFQYRNSVEISEDEIETHYNSTVKDSSDPRWNQERARALHILISDKSAKGRAEMNRVRQDLMVEQQRSDSEKLETFFRELAKNKSEDYSTSYKGGDLGYFGAQSMVKPFADAVFNKKTKLHRIVGPIESDFGFHLIYVLDRTSSTNSLKNRKAELKFELQSAQLKAHIETIKQDLQSSLLGKTAETPPLLTKYNFSVTDTEPLSQNDRNNLIPFTVIQTSFQKEKGVWAGPEEFEDNLFVFKVIDIQAPEQKSFEESKAEVRDRLRQVRAQEIIRNLQVELASDAIKWSDLRLYGAKTARHKNVAAFKIESVPGFSRSDNLLKAVQGLTEQSPLAGPLFHEDRWVLLHGENFKTKAEKESSVESLTQNLETARSASLLDSYVDKLIKAAKIPENFKAEFKI